MRLLLAAALVFAVSAAAAGPARVTLHPEVSVDGPYVRLGDLAQVAQEADLVVAHSPRAGRTLKVSRADLQHVLARLKPGVAFEIDGAEGVTVRRKPRTLAVARGETIAVRIVQGAIALETTARASRDAVAGEVIRVRGAGDREYLVRVVAAGAAEGLGR
jgi:flagella basal body P-ring formation protein FlgA